MNLFEAVKESVTARSAAEYYGIRVKRNGMACCPFHDDRTPSMKLDRRFHCFGCQEDGDVIDFAAKYFNLNLKEAAEKLAADFGISYDRSGLGLGKTRDSPAKPKLSPAKEYERAERRCFRAYCDYFHLLSDWKENLYPRTPEEEPDDRFVEACHKLDYVEYVLDEIFLSGTISDRAAFVKEHGKEVIQLEERIKEEQRV